MTDFEHWWYHEGSGPKLPSEDFEEHCKRMCKIAWSNGAYKSSGVLDSLLDEAKLLADDRPVEVGNLPKWTLDAEHMLRRLVKAFNSASQPAQQELVAWLVVSKYSGGKRLDVEWNIDADAMALAIGRLPLYTRPPAQRTWVGLTKEERDELWYRLGYMDLMIAIEAKLREKNQ